MFRLRPKPSREPLVVESSSAFEHFSVCGLPNDSNM
jgi:hypothetical protein